MSNLISSFLLFVACFCSIEDESSAAAIVIAMHDNKVNMVR